MVSSTTSVVMRPLANRCWLWTYLLMTSLAWIEEEEEEDGAIMKLLIPKSPFFFFSSPLLSVLVPPSSGWCSWWGPDHHFGEWRRHVRKADLYNTRTHVLVLTVVLHAHA